MFFYAEFFQARTAWITLSYRGREAYLDRLGDEVRRLNRKEVRLVRFAVNARDMSARTHLLDRPGARTAHSTRPGTASRRPCYLLVWKIADQQSVHTLDAALDRLDWSTYFVPASPDKGGLPLDPLSGDSRRPLRAHVREDMPGWPRAAPPISVLDTGGWRNAAVDWGQRMAAGSCSNLQ